MGCRANGFTKAEHAELVPQDFPEQGEMCSPCGEEDVFKHVPNRELWDLLWDLVFFSRYFYRKYFVINEWRMGRDSNTRSDLRKP